MNESLNDIEAINARKLIDRTRNFLRRQNEYLNEIQRIGVNVQGMPKNKMIRSIKKETAARGNVRNLYKILKRVTPEEKVETVIIGCIMCGALKSTIWRHLFPDSNVYDNPFLCNRCYDVFKTFYRDPRLVALDVVKLDGLMTYLFDYENLADMGAGQRKKYVLRPLASNKSGMAIKYDTLMSGRKQDKKMNEFITGYNYKAVLAKAIFQNFIVGAMVTLQGINVDFNQVLDSGREYGSLKRKKIALDILMDPINAVQNNTTMLINTQGIDFSKTNSPFSNETHYTPYGAVWRVRSIANEGNRNVATLDISFPDQKYEQFVFPSNILNFLIPDLPMIVGAVSKTNLNDGYEDYNARQFTAFMVMDVIDNNNNVNYIIS